MHDGPRERKYSRRWLNPISAHRRRGRGRNRGDSDRAARASARLLQQRAVCGGGGAPGDVAGGRARHRRLHLVWPRSGHRRAEAGGLDLGCPFRPAGGAAQAPKSEVEGMHFIDPDRRRAAQWGTEAISELWLLELALFSRYVRRAKEEREHSW